MLLRLLAQPPPGFAWCPCSTSGLCIPPPCASTLLPFVSSLALHCLEKKSKLFSSTVTPHRTPSLPSSLTFFCSPVSETPTKLASPFPRQVWHFMPLPIFSYNTLPKITFPPPSFTTKTSTYSTLLEVSPSSLFCASIASSRVSVTCLSSWVHDQLLESRIPSGLICASSVLLSVPSTRKQQYIFAERIDSFQRNGIVLKS